MLSHQLLEAGVALKQGITRLFQSPDDALALAQEQQQANAAHHDVPSADGLSILPSERTPLGPPRAASRPWETIFMHVDLSPGQIYPSAANRSRPEASAGLQIKGLPNHIGEAHWSENIHRRGQLQVHSHSNSVRLRLKIFYKGGKRPTASYTRDLPATPHDLWPSGHRTSQGGRTVYSNPSPSDSSPGLSRLPGP